MTPRPIESADRWWRNAVFYCLDIQVFQDSDGDGDGDIQGLVSRIRYLSDLGVTCLWLMPFFPTADRDDGYDITDFFAVDPRLGTLGDLVELVRVARERGMRVIVDFVMNHSSAEHPWFRASRSSKDSPFRDWYVWRDAPPPNPDPPVFPGEEDSTWTEDPRTGQHYLHHFRSHQPDLNVAHPPVQQQIERNLGLWLELGVSGFRIDAVPFLFSGAAHHGTETATDYDGAEHLRAIERFVSRRAGEAMLLGEVNLPHEQQLAWFEARGEAAGLQLQFDFASMQRLYLSLARGDARPLAATLRQRPQLDAASQWANFVRNHDELTLDQLTPDEREEVFGAFAPDEGMRLYGRGIRRRLPTMLGDSRAVRMVYALLFSLPGCPVLLYGEEIGLGEALEVPGRYAVRTPMQWQPDASGGFSTAPPSRWPRPMPDGDWGPDRVSVADQRQDPSSLWRHMQRLIALYRDSPELAWSTLQVVGVRQRAVLAHVCRADGWAMLALHNLGDRQEAVRLEVRSEAGPVTLVDRFDASAMTIDARLELELGPYGWRWLQLSPADATVRRV